MNNLKTLKIATNGGILPAGDLRRIAESAYRAGVEYLYPGERQDLLLRVPEDRLELLKRRIKNISPALLSYEDFQHRFTITAATPSVDLTYRTPWVVEETYRNILDYFTEQPGLRVNITDPEQGLIPLFTGDLNFIASPLESYWYLYLKAPGVEEQGWWPSLVFGEDIARLVYSLQEQLDNGNSSRIESLHAGSPNGLRVLPLEKSSPTGIISRGLPYYEGLHKLGDHYWLGISDRWNRLDTAFLESLARECMHTGIGSVHLTTWKSIIIKNIPEESLQDWGRLLGMHGINTAHSALEMNWQVPDLDPGALNLKTWLYRELDKRDIRTEGLVFALCTSALEEAASILITPERYNWNYYFHRGGTYKVAYRENFDPHSEKIISFSEGVPRRDLPEMISYLARLYYEQLGRPEAVEAPVEKESRGSSSSEEKEESVQAKELHQCPDCLTVYDPRHGDPAQNIMAGTPFEALPGDYHCPLCGTEKQQFEPIDEEALKA